MKTPPNNNPKPLPSDIENEQAIIGACLINPRIIPELTKVLAPEDMYRNDHASILKAIFSLKEKLTPETLSHQIPGKDSYILALSDAVSTSAGWPYHAKIVREHSVKRKLVIMAMDLIDQSERLSPDDLANNFKQGLQAIDLRDQFGFRMGVDISNVYTPEKCLQEYSSHIKTLKENRFITGIREIDKRIRGVGGGEVLFIIAQAGSFKTATLQNFLKNYINNSAWAAVFFSIEMSIQSMTERFHEIVQGASGRDIEKWYTTTKDGIEQFRASLEGAFKQELENLFIVPNKVSISDMASYVRLIEKEFKVKIGVIGVDYLGLMEGEGRGEYEIVSNLARGCKGLAKMLNIPVIVLAQTSRKAGSGDIEISLDMGRGSGAIEESADFVLGLFQVERERLSIEDDEPEYGLVCKILKNRKGRKGSRWMLDLEPENLRIGPDAEPWEPPKKEKDSF